jgi:cation:H+ antiporter
MSVLLLTGALLVVGLVGLVASAHFFVGGSAALAHHWGMRPGLIGLTIVAFGTSAPEIFVSAGAAIDGAPDLGIGNAVGSNIANIGMVLGITALITRLPVQRPLLRVEIPILTVATMLAAAFLADSFLSRSEGFILLAGAIAVPIFIVLYNKRLSKKLHRDAAGQIIADDSEIPAISTTKAAVWVLGGLIALLFSSKLLVDAATGLATYFNVSPMIIGLTVVAVGTSLPELASAAVSALKGHHELAIGNILGSNIFNIFAVMSLPGVIAPSLLDSAILTRDVLTMSALTLLLIAMVTFKSTRPGQPSIGAGSGIIFLAIYVGYYAFIFATH